jgi:hypothetical protein
VYWATERAYRFCVYTARQAAKALNIPRGAGFQPAGAPSGPGIRAAIGFDAGADKETRR